MIPEAARSNRAVSLPRERKPPSSALTSKVAGPWQDDLPAGLVDDFQEPAFQGELAAEEDRGQIRRSGDASHGGPTAAADNRDSADQSRGWHALEGVAACRCHRVAGGDRPGAVTCRRLPQPGVDRGRAEDQRGNQVRNQNSAKESGVVETVNDE